MTTIEERIRQISHIALLLVALWCDYTHATPPGIPEPGIVMYGKLTNAQNGSIMTPNVVAITVYQGFLPVVANAEIVDLDGTPHYMAQVRFDSRSGGNASAGTAFNFDPAPNSFELFATSPGYSRQASVTIGDDVYAASFSNPTHASFDFSAADRGRIIRIDLTVDLEDAFSMWATAAGLTGADALRTADPDSDGLINECEWIFKTDPTNTDPNEALHRFVVEIYMVPGETDHREIVFRPKWEDRFYRVIKKTDLTSTVPFAEDEYISTITNGVPIGDGATEASATDVGATEDSAFYRVEGSTDGTFTP